MRMKKVQYKTFPDIHGLVVIKGSKAGVRMGENVTIHSSAFSNPTSGFDRTYIKIGNGSQLNIGNNVGISNATFVACSEEGITIEDNVFIGSGCKIWDTDFHPVEYDKRIQFEVPKRKPILIKEGAFIGACSIILKGVTVGSHSVVGAGSVVTKDIPDNEIWAGNPATYIRRL